MWIIVAVITAVIVWLWGCSCAEVVLEPHIKNVDLRMNVLTPLLGMVWWLVAIVYHLNLKFWKEKIEVFFTMLDEIEELSQYPPLQKD